MILFKEDWEQYETAIPDYNTTNKSFLEYCSKLHAMGIENCLFPLSLLQPELSGVDVYDENLTVEQKRMIALECEWNPWYYLREVARVPTPGSNVPGKLLANRSNIALFWSFLAGIIFYLIMPRQTGKSINTDMLSTWMYIFRCRNSNMMLITKDNELRVKNILRLQKIRALLPEWLVYKNKHDAQNMHTVTYKLRENIYTTGVAQKSEEDALKLGRGDTITFYHFDEPPFIPFIDKIIPSALKSGNAAREAARAVDAPCGTIFTTTAADLSKRSGKYMHDLLMSGAVWTERFFDLPNKEVLADVITKKSKGMMPLISAVFSHTQLGKSDEWLYSKMQESASTGADADMDFFNRWYTGGVGHPLTRDDMKIITDSQISPSDSDIDREGYVLDWYIPQSDIPKAPQRKCIMALDTSDAIGKDSIGLVVSDAYTQETVATANVNDTSIPAMAVWVAQLLVKNPEWVMIIEKKSSAQTFIDTAITMLCAHGIDPLKRIFSLIIDKKGDKEVKAIWEELEKTPANRRNDKWFMANNAKKFFGFNTSGASRELLYSKVLKDTARNYGHLMRDMTLIGQIAGLEVRNGRVDHSKDGNDDLVIARLLIGWLMMYGKNLEHYGIDTSKIKVRVGHDGQVDSRENNQRRKNIDDLLNQAEDLTTKLKDTRSVYLMQKIEHKLHVIQHKLSEYNVQPETVTGILDQARQIKKNKSFNRGQHVRH